jgi:hypothetical protein
MAHPRDDTPATEWPDAGGTGSCPSAQAVASKGQDCRVGLDDNVMQ